MKRLLIITLLFLIRHELHSQSNCTSNMFPRDFRLNIVEVKDSLIAFNWIQYSGAAYYFLRIYEKQTDSLLTDTIIYDHQYTKDNLKPKTAYRIYVSARCSNGTQKARLEEFVKTTGNPVSIANITTDTVTATTAKISWTKFLPYQNYRVMYRLSGTFKWYETIVNKPKCKLTHLTPGKTYEYKVGVDFGLQLTYSLPESVYTFTTSAAAPSQNPRPNVLVVLLDDARQNAFQADGGPAWFETPGITRIANEGIRFKNAYVTHALCDPSRASIYTGLYPHQHGMLSEELLLFNDSLPTIASVLNQNGYYTGMLDKYGMYKEDPAPGWDYWRTSMSVNYFDQVFNIDGYDTIINGHRTDITNSYALEFLSGKPANVPFLLFLNYRAPHATYQPRYQDTALYSLNDMIIPENFSPLQNLYPTYLYPGAEYTPKPNSESDTSDLRERMLKYYQLIKGADDGIAAVLNYLDSIDQLDSTLVIFTSDNGYLLGENYLAGKRLAYEHSIRVPLYIRYPEWFADSTVVASQFASNIDLFPTILDAAGINDTFNLRGKSLRKIYNGNIKRPYFYYEYFASGGLPCIKAVRSTRYKYIRSYCDSLTEEFYDIQSDSSEMNNLIFKPVQQNRIQEFRQVMDSLIIAYGDTTSATVPCSLYQQLPARFHYLPDDDLVFLNLYPVPAEKEINVEVYTPFIGHIIFEVHDLTGKIVYQQTAKKQNELEQFVIRLTDLADGVYLLNYKDNQAVQSKRFVIDSKK